MARFEKSEQNQPIDVDVKPGVPMPSLFPDQSASKNEERILQACLDEVNAYFELQKKSKPVKTEMVFALYNILQKYPSLRHSEYKDTLTRIIATECEQICSIHLSTEELRGMWLG